MSPGELPWPAGEAGEDEEPVGSSGMDWSMERRVTKLPRPKPQLRHRLILATLVSVDEGGSRASYQVKE